MNTPATRVRIDKWLWAARFFRTRALAKKAIEGGHVSCDGERPKPSREIGVGTELTVRRGHVEQTIVVDAVSEVRRGAPAAQQLYTETPASIEARESQRLARRFANPGRTLPTGRPTKRERRAIDRLHSSAAADPHAGDDP